MVLARGFTKAVSACLILCLLCGSVSQAASVSDTTTEDRYDEVDREGSALRKKTEHLKKRIDEITSQLWNLEIEAESIDSEIRLTTSRLSDIEKKRDELRKGIYNDVCFFYRNRDSLRMEYALFHFKSWAYLINYSYYVSKIINSSRDRITEYESILADYEQVESELEDEKKQLQDRIRLLDELSIKSQEAVADLLEETEANERELEALQQQLLEEERERMRREAEERAAAEIAAISAMVPEGYTYTSGTGFYEVAPFTCSEDDVRLLASLIQAEAGGYNYDGMVAVGSVVLNRVFDSRFPNTIPEVIYAPGQFYPKGSGRLAVIYAQGPWESCVKAARDVIAGRRNVPYFYYKADWYAEEHGIRGVNIGGNVFHQ